MVSISAVIKSIPGDHATIVASELMQFATDVAGSQVPGSQVPGSQVPGPRFPVPGSRLGPRSQGARYQGARYQLPGGTGGLGKLK